MHRVKSCSMFNHYKQIKVNFKRIVARRNENRGAGQGRGDAWRGATGDAGPPGHGAPRPWNAEAAGHEGAGRERARGHRGAGPPGRGRKGREARGRGAPRRGAARARGRRGAGRGRQGAGA
jgi:hypothetical protein